jgi:ribose transport system substrate-binding protein
MKKMNKVLALVLVAVVLISGCATPAAPTAAPAPTTAAAAAPTTAPAAAPTTAPAADVLKGKTIGFVNAGPDDYYAKVGSAIKAVAATYGMNYVEVNSDYKPEKELANVQDLAAKGVDAIVVITAGAAGSAASVKAANDAKIPIFFIAGMPQINPGNSIQGHVTDNFAMLGYLLGQWVVKNRPNSKCVEIPGFLGQGPAEGQIVGFQMALDEAKYGTCKVLKSGEWQSDKSIPIAQDLIASNTPFDVIFGANGETVRGVLQVFNELNVTGKAIVSVNGKEDEWQWIKDGKEGASVPNPPSLNADLAVQQVVRYFNKQPYEQELQIVPAAVLDKNNIGNAIPWATDTYMAGRAANTFKWDLAYYEAAYLKMKPTFAQFDTNVAAYMKAHAGQ